MRLFAFFSPFREFIGCENRSNVDIFSFVSNHDTPIYFVDMDIFIDEAKFTFNFRIFVVEQTFLEKSHALLKMPCLFKRVLCFLLAPDMLVTQKFSVVVNFNFQGLSYSMLNFRSDIMCQLTKKTRKSKMTKFCIKMRTVSNPPRGRRPRRTMTRARLKIPRPGLHFCKTSMPKCYQLSTTKWSNSSGRTKVRPRNFVHAIFLLS